ncbi:hypothetical protein [Nitrosomonas communis]|uniref:Uncharacterized protein n=1 Tax=Nitrosomonas communis TaxID=44574 RepID=A0A1I4RJM6_9PROT|nr:hypothetical protein [Nitrosomonas communis]SFM52110.1 hypothetical protein SAMN05421863_103319 [Nitrosomonas communis]
MHNLKIDLESSRTKDEAIALLIGLGDMRMMPQEDAPPDEIDLIPRFCLGEYLFGEYDLLKSEYKWAVSQKQSEEIVSEKLVALNRINELIAKANICARYFDDEIAKGKESIIRIYCPSETSVPYYTLNSILQWWDQVKSEIDVSPILESNPSKGFPSTESPSEDWSSETKRENVLTTFAFLVEAFAETAPLYKDGGNPNATTISKKIEELATIANNGRPITAQRFQTIRKLIAEASEIKERTMLRKGNNA